MKFVTYIFTLLSICCSISAYGQMLDMDFENWVQKDTQAVKRPLGWIVASFPDSGKATTNAYSGDTAVVIWNWYSYAKGILAAGNTPIKQRSEIESGVPIDFKPTRLKGYYRYDLDNNQGLDSGQVIVMLKRMNPETQKRDTIGYGYAQLPPAEHYTMFEVPIADRMPGVEPDSIIIVFYSSTSGYCSGGDPYCCYLTIDALSLETSSGIGKPVGGLLSDVRLTKEGDDIVVVWQRYPTSDYSVVLYDLAGKRIRSWDHLTKEREALPVGTDLASGAYLYEIRSASKILAQGKLLAK